MKQAERRARDRATTADEGLPHHRLLHRLPALVLLVVFLAPASLWAATSKPAAQPPLEQRALQRDNTASQSQVASPTSSDGIGMVRLGLSLAAVVGLILLMRWGGGKLFKGQGGVNSNGVMQVVARSPIAPRQQLMLVRVGRRLVVVGNSGGQMTSLSQITDADEVAELLGQLKRGQETTAARFGSMFHRAERNYEEPDEIEESARVTDEAAGRAESAVAESAGTDSPAVMSAELGKLLEKVRGMARQLR